VTPWIVSAVFVTLVAAAAIRGLFFIDAYSASRSEDPPSCPRGKVCKDRGGQYMTIPCHLSTPHDAHWHGEFFDEHCRPGGQP
jgi:hypothetical protein